MKLICNVEKKYVILCLVNHCQERENMCPPFYSSRAERVRRAAEALRSRTGDLVLRRRLGLQNKKKKEKKLI